MNDIVYKWVKELCDKIEALSDLYVNSDKFKKCVKELFDTQQKAIEWLKEIKQPTTNINKWVSVEDDLPKVEGYYEVEFIDGTIDEKPFRIRPHKNIKGFMTEKQVRYWRILDEGEQPIEEDKKALDVALLSILIECRTGEVSIEQGVKEIKQAFEYYKK